MIYPDYSPMLLLKPLTYDCPCSIGAAEKRVGISSEQISRKFRLYIISDIGWICQMIYNITYNS